MVPFGYGGEGVRHFAEESHHEIESRVMVSEVMLSVSWIGTDKDRTRDRQ